MLIFAGTVLNQTHAAVQVMAITMGVYLVISLVISLALNIFNARFALKDADERGVPNRLCAQKFGA